MDGTLDYKALLEQFIVNNAELERLESLLDRCEWKNIDILLVSSGSKIVCVIENKVDSGEHSNQLNRYRKIVQQEFADYRQIFVFLTPQGILPDEKTDQDYWSIYSYRKIAGVLDDVCDLYRATLQPQLTVKT